MKIRIAALLPMLLLLSALALCASATHAAELRAGDVPRLPVVSALDGSRIDLNAQRGKVLVLSYFSVTCPFCMNEAPKLQKLYRNHADRLTVITVNIDEPDASQKARAVEWIRKYRLTHPVTTDYALLRPVLGRPKGLPVHFIFDREGRLQRTEIGEMLDEDFDDIARFAQAN